MYEALGMKEDLKEMLGNQVFLGIVEAQWQEIHHELQHKAWVEADEKEEKGKTKVQEEISEEVGEQEPILSSPTKLEEPE